MSYAFGESFAPIVKFSGTIEQAFPDVDPNFEPFGYYVLVQIRIAKDVVDAESKIVLPDAVRLTIQANTQVAKVIHVGPMAFRNRQTGEPWPEGAWVKEGDFIRVPKHGGDRWEVGFEGGMITFLNLRDLDISGRIPRPLDAVAYI